MKMKLKNMIDFIKGLLMSFGLIMGGVSYAYGIGLNSIYGFWCYIIFTFPPILIIMTEG